MCRQDIEHPLPCVFIGGMVTIWAAVSLAVVASMSLVSCLCSGCIIVIKILVTAAW